MAMTNMGYVFQFPNGFSQYFINDLRALLSDPFQFPNGFSLEQIGYSLYSVIVWNFQFPNGFSLVLLHPQTSY